MFNTLINKFRRWKYLHRLKKFKRQFSLKYIEWGPQRGKFCIYRKPPRESGRVYALFQHYNLDRVVTHNTVSSYKDPDTLSANQVFTTEQILAGAHVPALKQVMELAYFQEFPEWSYYVGKDMPALGSQVTLDCEKIDDYSRLSSSGSTDFRS